MTRRVLQVSVVLAALVRSLMGSSSASAQTSGPTEILDVHEIERRVGPAVVFIRSYHLGGTSAEGTGFAVASDGWIVTNQHVVGDSDDIEVWIRAAPDFQRYRAMVVEVDLDRDLALLRVDAQDLVTAELARPAELMAGTAVASLGYPEGIFSVQRQMRIVPGVVSHIGFPIGDVPERRWIVSDVKLREGNSGGPLVDRQGRVVGVNTIRRLDGETSLSIPVDEVLMVLADLTQIRERTVESWIETSARATSELELYGGVLAERAVPPGSVSRYLANRELAVTRRLLADSTTSFMTGHWVVAHQQLEGVRRQLRWLRSTLTEWHHP